MIIQLLPAPPPAPADHGAAISVDHGVVVSVDNEAAADHHPQPGPEAVRLADYDQEKLDWPEPGPEPELEAALPADYDQESLDWAVKMISFCLPPAVAIAVQFLKTDQSYELPLAFYFLSLTIIFSFNFLFLSKSIAPKFHGIAKLFERVGVFLAVMAIHIAITIPLPAWLSCATWTVFVVSCIAMHDTVLPVLIVGAEPVGLVLSILLIKLGVPEVGWLGREIGRSQPPVELWRKFIYCTSLTGSILGSVDQMQPQDLEKVVSPVSVAHFSQYKLVGLLLKQLEKLNFNVCSSEYSESVHKDFLGGKKILMGHECVSINATDQCMNVTASFLKEGKHMERNIQCNILIGTDGAGSTVRKLAGIDLRGEQDLQELVSVHFLSRDLGDYLLNERPGMLFFIFNTEVIGVLVAHDLKQGEFVLQLPFFPPQQNLEDFSPEICKKLIIKLVGRELSNVDVLDVKPWVMNAEVAEKYVCCDSRIILAGDAAHRFPPAGGFGMNTGIQDAHNLAWKIASVVKGLAPSSILHTYETERKQIAIFNTALSVQNFKAAMAVPSALGLDPTVANSVHRIMNKAVGPILPSVIQRGSA
ncbi:hypothetical protein Dsin_010607 [Dipteronia sinensis]|uniref:FAD-binding domain-containing protein n=1 Tax=Dipteronia sinensis TaxID=43782 RepID=A0AAE0ED78_9ROSI|nr:hypothetical protein Dsin_010607 [Dipteronia sinensis]